MPGVQHYGVWNRCPIRNECTHSLLGSFQYIQDFLAHLFGGQVFHDWLGRRRSMTPHFYDYPEEPV